MQGSGFIFVVLGLLLLYIAITGKFDLMENFFLQLFDFPVAGIGTPTGQSKTAGTGVKTVNPPFLPGLELPKIGADLTLPDVFGIKR